MSQSKGISFILAADIGGTRASFAIAEQSASGTRLIAERQFASRDFADCHALIKAYLATPEAVAVRGSLTAACFAVAGPVAHGAAKLTNLGWQVSTDEIISDLGLSNVSLINDFYAAGLGVTTLEDEGLVTLQAAEAEPHGTAIIIGAGTGLGVGIINWDGAGYRVLPSEAGHADFAATDELQDRLLIYLRRNFGHASWERVISGPGLMRIFSFLQDSGFGVPSKRLLEATKQPGADATEVIAEYALAKLDPLAVRALNLFIAAYGSFAGNMALAALARGGVYIAGGIAPRIINRLQEGGFMRTFTSKSAFTPLLSGIPVRVVMDAQVGLRGALKVAGQEAA